MARGRKSKYTPERVEIITKAIAAGKTYKQAFEAAGIGKDAFYNWLNEKQEFNEAIKKAEQEYNEWYNTGIVQDAKKSLRELVCGFSYTETTTETAPGKDGKTITKKKIVEKHMAPNPTAIIFALTNRDPENWKNRQTNEISGDIKTTTEMKTDLSKLPDELLEQVMAMLNEPDNE